MKITVVTPEHFVCRPQTGIPIDMSWDELGVWLSRVTIGEAKDRAGAWSPATYRNNIRRLDHLERVHALVVDCDQNGARDVAMFLEDHRCYVHSTFSSTPEAPRSRIVFALSEPIDIPTFNRLRGAVVNVLKNHGVVADPNAKDASRLSYVPVVPPGISYEFFEVIGQPLDVRAILQAHPEPKPAARVVPSTPLTSSRYSSAALRKAVEEVARARLGTRNSTLNREAFGLARLPELTPAEIEAALLGAATAAGLKPGEAIKTIHSALRARGAA
jgi:hypothetical protein